MNNCCVIGGSGFIGAKVVELLLSADRQVRVVGRQARLPQTLPGNVTYFAGDISDKAFMERVLSGVDEVIDLAYSSVPKSSFENPAKDISANLLASVGMLEVACTLPIRKMVFVSSGGTVYGEPVSLPISESHPTNPISPYGITKLALEKYAFMFHKLNGLPILCVRPSNAYGEGQPPFVGQGFVATATASLLSGRDIQVFGTNGTIRDYIYVDDLAQGIVAALESGESGECYNIGSGIGRNNLEVIESISRAAAEAGLKPRVRHLPARSFDVSANILDCRKLHEISGWRPQADFDASIRRTFQWYLSRIPHGDH